ncbi:polygalacturonase-like [Juglans microcarpa x Juglans regia]|uniref:polygalacturonase-like n=1 Tax=Juglans microcarpa x Juglans regia TaxID=2249226 RepID=UPI001B7EEAE7|nr:polygalacturonase-like [Juglans microcarpa x Juglans regia]
MGLKLNIETLSVLLFFLTSTANAKPAVFNIVKKYGGKVNEDITLPLTNAWKDACATPGQSTVVVPAGTYRLGPVQLNGPCKGPIELKVRGTLEAPGDLSFFKWGSWVSFERVDQLTLSGNGTFDGQGKSVWGKYNGALPINIRFDFITNSMIRGITSLDSKQFHLHVFACKNVTLFHLNIRAPGDSPNTDGIHMGRSTGINIIDSKIGTGDDCISLGDGNRDILIQKVACGPGHGISIGSLGKYENEEPVIGVKVLDCNLRNTMNGVRIKTWPASLPGIVSNMHFENIYMKNVSNPVIIDQVYCPWNQCKAQIPSKIKISEVSFKNIRGTSQTKEAVKLLCSNEVPCENVEISDIDLAYQGSDGPATSQCTNANPTISGKQNPPACTLK